MDVPEVYKFLEKYFGMRGMSCNNNIGFLTDDNGMILTLMSLKVGGESEVKYPVNFHIGFCQENAEQVNEINRRLKEDGYDVPPPSSQHGSWTFYFRVPGGFTIEVLS
jgi:catechol-2,3-dioxygenase